MQHFHLILALAISVDLASSVAVIRAVFLGH